MGIPLEEIQKTLQGNGPEPESTVPDDVASIIRHSPVVPGAEIKTSPQQFVGDIELEPQRPATFATYQETTDTQSSFFDFPVRTDEDIAERQSDFAFAQQYGMTKDDYRRNFVDNVQLTVEEEKVVNQLRDIYQQKKKMLVKDPSDGKYKYLSQVKGQESLKDIFVQQFPEYEYAIRNTPITDEEWATVRQELKQGRERNIGFAIEHQIKAALGPNHPGVIGDIKVDDTSGIPKGLMRRIKRAETPEEVRAEVKQFYGPNAEIFSVKFPNPPLSMPLARTDRKVEGQEVVISRDVTDLNQPFVTVQPDVKYTLLNLAPEIAGSLAAAYFTRGRSVWTMGLGVGGGFALGGMTEEAIEEIGGNKAQLESPLQIALRTGKEGLIQSLLTLAIAVPSRLARGQPLSAGLDPQARKWLQTIDEASKEIERATKGQISRKEALTMLPYLDKADDVMAVAQTGQVLGVTKSFQKLHAELLKRPEKMLEMVRQITGIAKTPDQARIMFRKAVDSRISAQTQSFMKTLNSISKSPATTPKQAQGQVKLAFQNWEKSVQAKTNQAWSKLDDFVAKGEKPVFDLTSLRKRASELRAEDKALMRGIADKPGGEVPKVVLSGPMADDVDRLLKDILSLNTTQYNYQGMKLLRERAGALFNVENRAGGELGKIKEIYKSITETLGSPVGMSKGAMAKYRALSGDATAMSIAKHEALSIQEIRNLMNSQNSGQFIEKLGKPGMGAEIGSVMSDDVASLLPKPDQRLLDTARTTAKHQIISKAMDGEISSLRKHFKQFQNADPEGFKLLFPGDTYRQFEKAIAAPVDKFIESGIIKASQQPSGIMLMDKILKSKADKATLKRFYGSMSDREAALMRDNIYDDFMASTLKPDKRDIFGKSFDAVAAEKKIEAYKRLGIWDSKVLSARDRKIFEGLVAYQERLNKISESVGSSMQVGEIASQKSSLLRPWRIMHGNIKIFEKYLRSLPMRSKWNHVLFTGNTAIPGGTGDVIIYGIVDSMKKINDAYEKQDTIDHTEELTKQSIMTRFQDMLSRVK